MLSSRKFIVTITADSDSRGFYHLKTHLEDVLRKLSDFPKREPWPLGRG